MAVDTIVQCVTNLPHKVLIYAALVSLVAQDNQALAQEIIQKVVE